VLVDDGRLRRFKQRVDLLDGRALQHLLTTRAQLSGGGARGCARLSSCTRVEVTARRAGGSARRCVGGQGGEQEKHSNIKSAGGEGGKAHRKLEAAQQCQRGAVQDLRTLEEERVPDPQRDRQPERGERFCQLSAASRTRCSCGRAWLTPPHGRVLTKRQPNHV
jgi:hypothetical protein